MNDALIETWRINSRIVIYTLNAIAPGALADRGATKGRSVGEMLAHIHNHEFYHLGEVGVALQQSGHPLDKKTAFGMWEWGTR